MPNDPFAQPEDAIRLDRPITAYEISLNARVGWIGHSMSNIGSNGSNRLMPRRQMLASGIETDACSGSLLKHEGAESVAEYLEAAGQTLCTACARRDTQRAASLANEPNANLEMEELLKCGLCDVHGFLIPLEEPRKTSRSGGDALKQLLLSMHLLWPYPKALLRQHRSTLGRPMRTEPAK